MGWTFVRASRDQLIQELISPQETVLARSIVIDHALNGKVLWTVVRVTAKQVGVMNLAVGESICYIGCDVLESAGLEWGYKSLDESVHPYYYSCPLRYLDMAPERCPKWRENVRAYHAWQSQALSAMTSAR